jgi:outer membrane protein TolC
MNLQVFTMYGSNAGSAAGLTEIKDVTEALVAFFKTKLSYIKAIYDFNIASISLTFAVGGE